jgi:hypothetical protein
VSRPRRPPVSRARPPVSMDRVRHPTLGRHRGLSRRGTNQPAGRNAKPCRAARDFTRKFPCCQSFSAQRGRLVTARLLRCGTRTTNCDGARSAASWQAAFRPLRSPASELRRGQIAFRAVKFRRNGLAAGPHPPTGLPMGARLHHLFRSASCKFDSGQCRHASLC